MSKAAGFDPLQYASPVEADARFVSAEMRDGWVMSGLRGGAVAVMPGPLPDWSPMQHALYRVRRDANVLGSCPACEALAPARMVNPKIQRAAMLHEADCPIGDDRLRPYFQP